MIKNYNSRRTFIKNIAAVGAVVGLPDYPETSFAKAEPGKRVGIIGLDTSHSTAFTQILNGPNPAAIYGGYKIVAAYPHGSKDIKSSYERIPAYTEEVKKLGVEIVDSIADLLKKTDVILLETNDGRLHKEQALQVLKAGKRMFIDKPVAASLSDVVDIFNASKKYGVPVFSTSSLRYMKGMAELDKSKVVGADMYSPAEIEKTHPDLFWYGIHGIEALIAVMGTGCKEVIRVHTQGTDMVVGTWHDGRIGTFRGTRTGKGGYGGFAYTEDGNKILGPYMGYETLLQKIIGYFETGIIPVPNSETLEIFAFLEAGEESRRKGGLAISLADVMQKFQKS